jgi:hypothetical protein
VPSKAGNQPERPEAVAVQKAAKHAGKHPNAKEKRTGDTADHKQTEPTATTKH